MHTTKLKNVTFKWKTKNIKEKVKRVSNIGIKAYKVYF